MAALLLLGLASITVSGVSVSECEGLHDCDAPAHKVNMLLQLGAVAQSKASRLESEFEVFAESYERKYVKGSDEYRQRMAYFQDHLERAELVNNNPESLWKAAPGPLWDFSPEELAAARGWSGRARRQRSQKKAVLLNQMTLPEKFGWAHLSSLTRAAELDQGACGSCWATATAKVLNAHAEIYNSSQTSFSIQDLVDCVPNPARCGGTGGCQGSTTELAMQYVMEYGIHTEAEKSYVGQDQECSASLTDQDKMSFSDEAIRREGIHNASSAAPGLSIGLLAFEVLPMNQYQPLLLALYEKGPVAVSVDASMWSLYSTGIFNSCEKDAVINHAVTLIGWGAQSDKKYWTIQNSWGSAWGENGLVRLLRHDNDDWCGTDYYPLDGTGCEGGASEVAVCGMCGVHSDSVIPHFAKRAE